MVSVGHPLGGGGTFNRLFPPLTAAFTRYSYPTGLLSVSTSLKTFYLNWTSRGNVIPPGEITRAEPIMLSV